MGDENQQPKIHVESHGQTGGITAYQVNIQPGDRQLKPNVAQDVKDKLSEIEFEKIEVNAVMGDGEAFRFASQIKNFLVSEGFEIKGVNQVLYANPPQGQIIETPKDEGTVRIIIGSR